MLLIPSRKWNGNGFTIDSTHGGRCVEHFENARHVQDIGGGQAGEVQEAAPSMEGVEFGKPQISRNRDGQEQGGARLNCK